MDYDKLWTISDRARSGERLTNDEIGFVRDVAPKERKSFPDLALPARIRHPAGFSVSGAPIGTFLRSALLLGAQKAFGKRYEGSAFYGMVERDLAFGIMRSHFHNAYPKGAFCCGQCTLAVYPVLETGGIRYFDCVALSRDVRRLIEGRGWRFAKPPNAKMVRWALPQLKH